MRAAFVVSHSQAAKRPRPHDGAFWLETFALDEPLIFSFPQAAGIEENVAHTLTTTDGAFLDFPAPLDSRGQGLHRRPCGATVRTLRVTMAVCDIQGGASKTALETVSAAASERSTPGLVLQLPDTTVTAQSWLRMASLQKMGFKDTTPGTQDMRWPVR